MAVWYMGPLLSSLSCYRSILASFIFFWHMIESFRKRGSLQENTSKGKACCILLISNRCGWVQPIVSGANPRHMILLCIRKQAKQALESSPVCLSPWSLLQFLPPSFYLKALPWLHSVMECVFRAERRIIPFFPKLSLARLFHHRHRILK